MSEYLLSMKGIKKIYGNGVIANDGVDFNLKEGEIHALMGENGAGKSTLMKILFGMEQANSGSIYLRGHDLGTYESKDAIRNGIGMVHQHFMLVDSFTVAQNVMLGIEPRKGTFTDRAKCNQLTREASLKYNLEVDPEAITGKMPVGVKQKIEILKALVRGAKILILDEPTAVLTPQETDLLFDELKNLRDMGYSIIFISHKIREVKAISSRITVMRDGKNVGVYDTDSISEEEISALIMGSNNQMSYEKSLKKAGEPAIRVRNISYYHGQAKPILKNINFNVRRGEILGIAGVQGNGQVELVQLLTKGVPLESGSVELNGQLISTLRVQQMRDTGYAYIPEDRLQQGVGATASIAENLITNRYSRDFSSRNMLDKKKIQSFSKNAIEAYEIKCFSEKQPISMLSGGNMQKVVVARECSGSPSIVIAEQPTRGIDIGAAYMVHRALFDLRDKGAAILMVSADLSELLQVCDSLMVIYGGEIVAYFEDLSNIREEELGLCMLGLHRHDAEQIERVAHE